MKNQTELESFMKILDEAAQKPHKKIGAIIQEVIDETDGIITIGVLGALSTTIASAALTIVKINGMPIDEFFDIWKEETLGKLSKIQSVDQNVCH